MSWTSANRLTGWHPPKRRRDGDHFDKSLQFSLPAKLAAWCEAWVKIYTLSGNTAMSAPLAEPSVREIAQMLQPLAESIAWQLFPNAKRDGPYLCVGSLQGEAGKSLKIKVRGSDAGSWADYATSKGDPRGKGDMLKLLQLTLGNGDIGAAVREAKRMLSIDSMDPMKLERHRRAAAKAQARAEQRQMEDKERARAQAEGLWQSAAPLTPSSPPVLYLQGRGIDFARLGKLPGALRFHPEVWHAQLKRKLPAMVSKFSRGGLHAATHVTYLELVGPANGPLRWVKLTTAGARRMGLPQDELLRTKIIRGPAHTHGAHIALWKGETRGKLDDIPQGTPVEVAEGIEDGLSYAMAHPAARIVAAGTLGIIEVMHLPRQAGDLHLLAQNDDKAQPREALERAIAAQQRRAGEAGIPRTVACRWPRPEFKDWNDWLMGKEKEA